MKKLLLGCVLLTAASFVMASGCHDEYDDCATMLNIGHTAKHVASCDCKTQTSKANGECGCQATTTKTSRSKY